VDFVSFFSLSSIFWLIFLLVVDDCVAMSAATATINNDNQSPTYIPCTICQERYFESRNQLFDHLRDEHGYQRDLFSVSVPSTQDRTAASIAARSTYQNPHHDAYYRRQCQAGVMTLEEWEQASEYFRKPLTIAFRVSSTCAAVAGPRREYWKWLEQEAGDQLVTSSFLSSCRMARRPLREWSATAQQALSDAQEVGVVNRQELCSMIPPLLLLSNLDCQTKSGKRQNPTILDLCAAPGSKTLQLLDLVSGEEEWPFQGMVVANDANRPRLLTVARRARIMGQSSSKTSLILNASDGRFFPALRKWAGYKVKFDYVLADVPCSGDGTLRKMSSNDWKQWNVKQHLTLHKLQLRLLKRSLELVKKGGRVVYSTCSLDPLENEAVVASAILQMGGPGVYRIVKAPDFLQKGALEPFHYTPGGSSWVVPHPKFDAHENPTVYEHFDQVPEQLLKKDILPSMFPPTDNDKAMDGMLSNCCRILPQHLDSGGFFCAIIERVPPEYFAVCCPGQREEIATTTKDGDTSHHGRIYHLIEDDASTADISQNKRMRAMLRTGNAGSDEENTEYYFEGLPTFERAQQWLRQHSAYVPGRSETAITFPSMTLLLPRTQPSKQWYSKDKNNNEDQEQPVTSPLYTPLVSPPHPDLVTEFVDFFGLSTAAQEAQEMGVDRFPVEELIVLGGGEGAAQVASNRMGEETATATANTFKKKPKFLQLTLVSDEIRTLFTGGAKFNPMELGLALCWVPVVAGSTPRTIPLEIDRDDDKTLSRAEKSGRYGLSDEAAELVGRCATKRLLYLSLEDGIELLQNGRLRSIGSRFNKEASCEMPTRGAIIAICPTSIAAQDVPSSLLYLSCVLQPSDDSLELLTEGRSANAWLRLLLKSQATTLD
jgi:16S rRNA C967 or C1407 C5-methylase (RsmB/RsmF family)